MVRLATRLTGTFIARRCSEAGPGRVLEKGLVLLEYRDVYAGGRLVGSGSTDVITIVNPATEEVTGAVPSVVERDVEVAVSAARQAFDTGGWPLLSAAERAAALDRLAA